MPARGWDRGGEGLPGLARDAPPGAFASPFGPRFVAGFSARWRVEEAQAAQLGLTLPPPPRSIALPAAGYSAAAVGAVILGLSIWQARVAAGQYEDYQATYDRATRVRLERQVSATRGRATALGVAAGAALSTGRGLLTWHWAAD